MAHAPAPPGVWPQQLGGPAAAAQAVAMPQLGTVAQLATAVQPLSFLQAECLATNSTGLPAAFAAQARRA
eukprot:CAMPEP_0204545934 /NCGR_PEP_ID=MMETSP0661-20131031/21640_1 /ASSEMBLY_ACC=CAM_ASM_000606 /TAXON_ID=109239 /ORGANISM="Alexandrium margalefi, Strain AMGDE01CS-322" /LENGTH=69 /DNA_ID=CAMNT_0051552737 /DNA_START=1 /DNA_END=207 /DNA_ORIENTATION=+